jgi:hypothetical protein
VWVQPVAGSQASVVHGLASSQLGAEPPAQAPPAHWSIVVQKLPSLHALALFVVVHCPVVGLQASSVHGLASLHTSPVEGWAQPPLLQTSLVQRSPSLSQGAAFGTCMQPVTGSQESSVQGLPSSQACAEPVQAPPTH